MTTKTMMMALAMAMGLAASASVIEVKFTVKTDVNGKVTTKTYKGVYDTKEGKHAFYDVKAKKTIDGSYFGLVNETTAGKKVGQNAELIWGDMSDPKNVLVAGAWGTDSSKSGQVAGMIDGKPATGTWSAKESSKSYDALLKKYKINAQPTNEATSTIDNLTGKVAAALAEAKELVAAAQAEADAKVKAAEDKSADEIAAAKKDAEDQIATAKEEAKKLIDAANEELKKTQEELATFEGMVEDAVTLNDPKIKLQFSNYLTDKAAEATALYTTSTNETGKIDAAYTNYTDKLDVDKVNAACENAKAAWEAAVDALAAAANTVTALNYTNKLMYVSEAQDVDGYFDEKTNDWHIAYVGITNALANANVDYTNAQAQAKIKLYGEDPADTIYGSLTNKLAKNEAYKANREVSSAEAETAMNTAKDNFKKYGPAAGDLSDADFKAAVEAGAITDFDVWFAGSGYTEDQKQEAFVMDEYLAAVAAERRGLEGIYDAAVAVYVSETNKLAEFTKKVEKTKADITIATDTINMTFEEFKKAYEAKVAEAEAELEALEAERKFWKGYQFSQDDHDTLENKTIPEAEKAREDAEKAEKEAKKAYNVAKKAVTNIVAAQEEAFDALEGLVGNIGEFDTSTGDVYVWTWDADARDYVQKILTLDEIKAAVYGSEAYTTYADYADRADKTLKAIEDLAKKLEVEYTK